MIILKIEPYENDKIIVTVEGYPHAKPVFNANLSPDELQTALKEWKVRQDAVDAVNAQRNPTPSITVNPLLKALEGTDVK